MSGISSALLVIAAVFAIAYLTPIAQKTGILRTFVKTVPLVLFATIAWLESAPILLVPAFALSALGDAFLAREGDQMFMAGLGSFLIAHLLFAWAFFTWAGKMVMMSWLPISGIGLFALVFGTVLVRNSGALAIPVGIYVLAIAVMGFGAAGVGGLVFAGSLLFMASDALLGTEKFLLPEDSPWLKATSTVVWVLYVSGQALILVGVL